MKFSILVKKAADKPAAYCPVSFDAAVAYLGCGTILR